MSTNVDLQPQPTSPSSPILQQQHDDISIVEQDQYSLELLLTMFPQHSSDTISHTWYQKLESYGNKNIQQAFEDSFQYLIQLPSPPKVVSLNNNNNKNKRKFEASSIHILLPCPKNWNNGTNTMPKTIKKWIEEFMLACFPYLLPKTIKTCLASHKYHPGQSAQDLWNQYSADDRKIPIMNQKRDVRDFILMLPENNDSSRSRKRQKKSSNRRNTTSSTQANNPTLPDGLLEHMRQVWDWCRLKHQHREEHISRLRQACENGSVVECVCCGEKGAEFPQCEKGHNLCSECIMKWVETGLSDGKAETRCLSMEGCSIFNDVLFSILPSNVWSALERAQTRDSLNAADLENLIECPKCDFAATVDDPQRMRVIQCQRPECEYEFCTLCREESHIPLRCSEAKQRNSKDEFLNNKVVLRCPGCNWGLYKEHGCNHITCPNRKCRTESCWQCKKQIIGSVSAHYGVGKCQQFNGDGSDTSNRKFNEEQLKEAERLFKEQQGQQV